MFAKLKLEHIVENACVYVKLQLGFFESLTNLILGFHLPISL